MTTSDWLVIVAAAAAIAWINWHFFFAKRSGANAVVSAGGSQEVDIVVKGGYTPSVVHAKEGVPLRLVFDRQETSSCSDEIVIGDFGIRTYLPAFQQTVVELTPTRPGRFEFTCGMGMLHGALVVGR